MRSKSEILESLTSRMSSSDVWKKLKNGLLGKELLALGAEIISESENVKDTMLLQLNPETSDKYGLYLLSQMNEIPITNIKPSAIVVQMASDAKTYAPFELAYNCGNVTFYNTEYTMSKKVVSLICGEPKTIYDYNADIVSLYDGGKLYTGIMLGNAYPDSISVFDGTTDVEIPRYSPDTALSNTIDVMYKVVTSVDGNQYIRFVCSDGTTEPYSYYIKYIDHSSDPFDFDESDMSVKDGNTVVGEVKYTSQGSVDNLEYMRNQLKGGMSIYNGLNTPKSIERYVNSLPYVIDSKCVPSENGGINIYIKPSSDSDLTMYLDFSEIAAHVALNTVLFPNVRVKTGSRLKFGLSIGGIKDEIVQNSVKNMLQKTFAYENLKFNSMVNVSQVLSEIYSHHGIVPSVNMNVTEDFVNEKPLSYIPIKNTFKGYDVNGALVAWEHDGLIYGRDNTATSIPFFMYDVMCAVGKMFLLKMRVDYTESEDSKVNYVKVYDESYNVKEQYNTYNDDVVIPIANKYNRFYLYDASTDMIKPFDTTMNMLLQTDTSPSVLNRAWHNDNQMFGNLCDAEVVSINGGISILFVLKSAGTQTTDGGAVGTKSSSEGEVNDYQYWNKNNNAGYGYYLRGGNVSLERNPNHIGKFQTMITLNQSPSLMDLSSDAWNKSFAADGVEDWFRGFYSGMKNYDNNGVKHNIHSNLFLFEENVYWIKQITDARIVIAVYRGAIKDIVVPINGILRGMIPYGSSLYVILDRSIIEIEGFSGFKQKMKTYNAYRDFSTPLNIIDIERGFDNHIIIKTPSEVYIADGFEKLSDSKMSFRNIKRIFEGIDVSECEMGSCTDEYATMYKRIEDDEKTTTIFYCCNLETLDVKTYDKTSVGNLAGTKSEEVEKWSYNEIAGNMMGDVITIDESGFRTKPIGSSMGVSYNVNSENFETIDTQNNTVTYTVQKIEYLLDKSPSNIYKIEFTNDYGNTLSAFHGKDRTTEESIRHIVYKDYSAKAILEDYANYYENDGRLFARVDIYYYVKKFLSGDSVLIGLNTYSLQTTTYAQFVGILFTKFDSYVNREFKGFINYFYSGRPFTGKESVNCYLEIWVKKVIATHTYTQSLVTQSKAVGWIDYKTNKIVNDTGVGIDKITYDCKTPNLQDDTYLVLDKNAINFE